MAKDHYKIVPQHGEAATVFNVVKFDPEIPEDWEVITSRRTFERAYDAMVLAAIGKE
jgi:hypothetical protein